MLVYVLAFELCTIFTREGKSNCKNFEDCNFLNFKIMHFGILINMPYCSKNKNLYDLCQTTKMLYHMLITIYCLDVILSILTIVTKKCSKTLQNIEEILTL